MRWKYRVLLGFLAFWLSIVVYQVLFAPGSLFRIGLARTIKNGAPVASTVGMLKGKGFTCADFDPPGTGSDAASILCYRFNDADTAQVSNGTQVVLAGAHGKIAGFAIRACGPSLKFMCNKADARPGWR